MNKIPIILSFALLTACGLSQEEKKEVYSNAAAATRKLLRQEFSKEEVMSIIRLERQSFKK